MDLCTLIKCGHLSLPVRFATEEQEQMLMIHDEVAPTDSLFQRASVGCVVDRQTDFHSRLPTMNGYSMNSEWPTTIRSEEIDQYVIEPMIMVDLPCHHSFHFPAFSGDEQQKKVEINLFTDNFEKNVR